jgi:hypothetical protein
VPAWLQQHAGQVATLAGRSALRHCCLSAPPACCHVPQINTRLLALVANHDSIEADPAALEKAAEVYRDLLSSVRGRGREGRCRVLWERVSQCRGEQALAGCQAVAQARRCRCVPCPQISSVEEADKKMSELAAEGKIDPAFLQVGRRQPAVVCAGWGGGGGGR